MSQVASIGVDVSYAFTWYVASAPAASVASTGEGTVIRICGGALELAATVPTQSNAVAKTPVPAASHRHRNVLASPRIKNIDPPLT
jgi:hypothetical protein